MCGQLSYLYGVGLTCRRVLYIMTVMKKSHTVPKSKFNFGDIVFAPRWRFGRRRFVMAEIVHKEYVYPGGNYTDNGYDAGWQYKVRKMSGGRAWKEPFEPRLIMLKKREY